MTVMAQTQQGYVKTLGRPDKPGQPLSGVSVRVKGGHNAVLSGDKGTFAMPMAGMKAGDAYQLQQVQKQGFELNDPGVLGRPYAFSDRVPLTVTMVSSQQLQADKQRIENKAYEVAERNYKAQLSLLENQQKANALTADEYRQQLQQLQHKFSKYESLIDELANHYARTDYDGLSQKERDINLCIERGELEKADSLLHTLFDPTEVLRRNQQALARIEARVGEARRLQAKARADMEAILRQQQKDAEYLYQLYTISLGRFDNDKAKFYIETRAELDTTNVDWQLEAGQFAGEFLADYDHAMQLIQRALRNAVNQYGERSEQVALVYDKMAHLYEDQKKYAELQATAQQSLDLRRQLYTGDHRQLAASLSMLGTAYAMTGQFDKAEDLDEQSIEMRKKVLPEQSLEMAESYFGLGYVYICTGKLADGLAYMQHSIDIMRTLYGDNYIHTADGYHNMGHVYMMTGDYANANEYLTKGLEIRRRLFGDFHPDVAESLNGLGTLFLNKGEYQKGLAYYQQALQTRLTVFGEWSPLVATVYNNMGTAHSYMGEKTQALELYQKSLAIQRKTSGERHPETAATWLNVSLGYEEMGDYDKALDAAQQAAEIMVSVLGPQHENVASCYYNLGTISAALKMYSQSIEFHQKALDIRLANFGEKHSDTAISYHGIGYTYSLKGEHLKAIEYFQKALGIWEKTLGLQHPNVKAGLRNLDACYKAYIAKKPKDKKMLLEYEAFQKRYMKAE